MPHTRAIGCRLQGCNILCEFLHFFVSVPACWLAALVPILARSLSHPPSCLPACLVVPQDDLHNLTVGVEIVAVGSSMLICAAFLVLLSVVRWCPHASCCGAVVGRDYSWLYQANGPTPSPSRIVSIAVLSLLQSADFFSSALSVPVLFCVCLCSCARARVCVRVRACVCVRACMRLCVHYAWVFCLSVWWCWLPAALINNKRKDRSLVSCLCSSRMNPLRQLSNTRSNNYYDHNARIVGRGCLFSFFFLVVESMRHVFPLSC